ncbi:MAG: FtsX-like permease family protein [Clostridia bacterium]|nr:FtsX-like permease family protein [Clostridia bacterium]
MNIKLIKGFILHNLRFFLLLVLCSGICFSSYVTFRTVQDAMEQGLNTYLEDYHYYDGFIQPYYGTFLPGDADALRGISGIDSVTEAYSVDAVLASDRSKYIRLVGIDVENQHPFIIEEVETGDFGLSAEFASYADIHCGDSVDLHLNNREISLVVKSLGSDPKAIGATRSIGASLEISSIGYAYIPMEKLGEYVDVSLPNTLIYYLEAGADPKAVEATVHSLFEDRLMYYEINEDRHANISIANDLDALRPVATMLPVLMYLIGLVVSVLFLRQFIEIKAHDIGILRANGRSKGGVVGLFVGYALVVAVSACLLGVGLSAIQSRIYTDLYTDSVYLPKFAVHMDAVNIIAAACLTCLFMVLAVFVNIRQIVSVDIVEIMNDGAQTKQAGMKFLRNRQVGMKPFLAPVFGKPATFLFAMVNMMLVCVIVTASFGVRDAKDHSIDFLYDKEIDYDYALHYYSYAPLENNGDDTCVETYVDIEGEFTKLVAMNNTDYIHVCDLRNRPLELGDGIIIYSRLADTLGIGAGDTVTLNGREVTVDAVCKSVADYRCYMSIETYADLFGNDGCNVRFIRGDLPEFDDSPESGFFYVSNVSTLRRDIRTKMVYLSRYIFIIIGFACLICVIVIYNLSVIFYRRRIREHMILRTLGYSYIRVLLGSMIEIVLQTILTLIIGLPLGYRLAAFVVHAISNDAVTMYITFADVPVGMIAAFIFTTAILGRIIASPGQIRLLPKDA